MVLGDRDSLLVHTTYFLSHCGNRSSGPRVRLEGLSSLDRSTGEVGVRGALGPSPPCTSEDKRQLKGKWDDGSPAGTLSAPLRGSPLPQGRTAGWFAPTYEHTRASVRRYVMAHSHRTRYMGTDGRWNGANSPIEPWQHGHEGGAERGDWRVYSTA